MHVLTMTRHGTFVLVQQFRPVIERWTLEFPGGLRGPGEQPDATAARELREETGFVVVEIFRSSSVTPMSGASPTRFLVSLP